MNEISTGTPGWSRGPQGNRKFREFFEYLLSERDGVGWNFQKVEYDALENPHEIPRLAPSIVTRSEVEVFGVAAPRFAIRYNIKHSQRTPAKVAADSVIQFRRELLQYQYLSSLESLKYSDRTARYGRRHPKITGIKAGATTMPLYRALEEERYAYVADCLLCRPSYLGPYDYALMETPLHSHHGEMSVASEPVSQPMVTSFMQHAPLAGGLCAQACCYMATVMMLEHATNVYGLTAISYLAGPPDLDELLIAGLDEQEIGRYFSKVNLNATHQRSDPGQSHFKGRRNREYLTALRSYVLSGIPVILWVEILYLVNKDVYKANGVQIDDRFEEDHAHLHAVLVVGCSRRGLKVLREDGAPATDMTGGHEEAKQWQDGSFEDDYEYVIHDPATYPFIRVHGRKLTQMGAVVIEADEAVRLGKDPNSQEFRDMMKARAGGDHKMAEHEACIEPPILPVTPAAVKLHLLPSIYHEPDQAGRLVVKYHAGLMKIGQGVAPNYVKRRYLLAQLNNVMGLRLFQDSARGVEDESAGLRAFLVKCAETGAFEAWGARAHGWAPTHWVWLELRDEKSILIWDAEILPASLNRLERVEPRSYLRGQIEKDAHGHRFRWDDGQYLEAQLPVKSITVARRKRRQPYTRVYQKQGGDTDLNASIISSYDAFSLQNSFMDAPEDADYLEIYAFMQDDLQGLKIEGMPNESSPLMTLAKMYRAVGSRLDLVSRTAEALLKKAGRRKIIGFATFVPEISSTDQTTAELAVDCLRSLVLIGDRLMEKLESEDRQFTIELVGGSLIQGLWPAEVSNDMRAVKKAHAVNIADRKESVAQLLKRLEPVAELAARFNGMKLALELEPGPLYVLANAESLVWVCNALDKAGTDSPLSKTVGFNCDIPHWGLLEKIPLKWLNGDRDFGTLSKEDGKKVARRIIHAHISDHSTGHFSDNDIGLHHEADEFKDWVDFISDRASDGRPRQFPKYSRYVSLEMELCKDKDIVKDAFNTLKSLV